MSAHEGRLGRALLPTVVLLATAACASRVADEPAAPPPTTNESRTVAYEQISSRPGVAVHVGRTVRVDPQFNKLDVHVEVRVLDVVAKRTRDSAPGATIEFRLVDADGSDVPFSEMRQGEWSRARTIAGRGWTGFIPDNDEPRLWFEPIPPDPRVPYGWEVDVIVRPVDDENTRLHVSGGWVVCVR